HHLPAHLVWHAAVRHGIMLRSHARAHAWSHCPTAMITAASGATSAASTSSPSAVASGEGKVVADLHRGAIDHDGAARQADRKD
ncbi:MAG: hypothetical protein OEM93_21085, partial [Rhodospirillales bacterium]|nr:hypothetical protein [Rhodospirillales bacterium]